VRLLYASRFFGTAFLTDLCVALGEGAPFEARPATGGTLAEARRARESAAPVVLLGLPKLALVLAPTLRDRLSLILDGAEGYDERRAARLAGLRVASFSFPLYSALRRVGADAAQFSWAPRPVEASALQDALAFVEPGAWPARETLAMLRERLGVTRFVTRAPRGIAERVYGFAQGGAERLADAEAAETLARAGVFIAARAHSGLDGGFLDAMARGALVVAPPRGLAAEFLTHGVDGLIEGRDIDGDLARTKIGDAARRFCAQARRRFEEDRERLRDFAHGRALSRRTIARIVWPPAPAGAALSPEAREGGKRLRGDAKADRPGAPLVTAAIVVRNARESFAPTLASILAQDYPNLEVVAVDGASSDGTREEIAAHDDALDCWISEGDKGPYDGMNKAARHARGRFLIFMNAGDFFAHERAVSEAFEGDATPGADIVVGHHVYVDPNGVESLNKNADFDWTYNRLARGELSWEWWNGVPCGQAVFIRSELLREQPFDTSFRIAADHAFLYEARRRGRRFAHCGGVIGVYTAGGLSSANDRKTAAEILRIAREFGPREKIDAWFRKNLPIALG